MVISQNSPWQLPVKDYEPVALSMCRWTEWKHGKNKKVGVFLFVAAMHSGLFPDTVGVEITSH